MEKKPINAVVFHRELKLRGAMPGYRGCSDDGDLFYFDDTTPEQIAAIEAVYADHDADAPDDVTAVQQEFAILDSYNITRPLEDLYDAIVFLGGDAHIPPITRNRILRKKELREYYVTLSYQE
jgi:hypothetical protein